MSGRVTLLSVLLAVQLAIVAAVLLTQAGFGEQEQGPFLTFETAEVDEIRITGGGEDGDKLVLTRAEDGWQLPDGMPASPDKVQDVLGKLAELRAPWPVATSGGAAERFEVADENFQRRVVLAADGDPVVDLYLGTSPGYQQVHARRAGDDAVFSVALSNYQLPAKSDDWLDKTLLQPEGEVAAVERAGGWQLQRDEEGWLVNRSAADQEAAEDLVRRVSELRVVGVADALPADAEPTAVVNVTDEKGTYQLSFFGSKDDNQYRIRSDRHDGVFELAGYIADQLLVEQQTLVAAQDESEQDEPAAGDDAADDAAPPAETAAETSDGGGSAPGAPGA